MAFFGVLKRPLSIICVVTLALSSNSHIFRITSFIMMINPQVPIGSLILIKALTEISLYMLDQISHYPFTQRLHNAQIFLLSLL